MKQLKFMIAAAAAIGLAGAAQAGVDFPSDTDKDALGNTGFEEFAAETAVTTGTSEANGGDSYFWYTGDVAADNESKVIAGVATLEQGVEKSPRAKGAKFEPAANVLQVNTGTDPLLRTINRVVTNEGVSSADPVTVPETGIYIDTLVQFTVTPAGDTVTPGEDDKLMIYLQEVADDADTTEVNEAATNLMVKCKQLTNEGDDREPVLTLSDEVVEAKLNNVAVEPGVWYRLTVKSEINNGFVVFSVAINGVTLTTTDALNAADNTRTDFLPSIKGADATLKAVGFAGEGLVDDIVFSTTQEELETSVDFTLASVVGASAVKAVIGDVEYSLVGGKFSLPAGTTTFRIDYEPVTDATLWNPKYTAALSDAVNCSFAGLTVTLDSGAPYSAKLTVTATEGTSAPTVDENAAADSVGITTPAFSNDKGAALQKVVDWAVKAGLTKAQLNEMPPFEATTGDATNTMQEAFLLNCAVKDVGTAKAAFKVSAFSVVLGENGMPQVTAPTTTSWNDGTTDWNFNGTPDIRGAATLNGAYGDIDANSKFFKAFLVK